MSYNGSGTFLINTAGQPVVSGTVISSTAFNALTADLATGLSTAITKDGQTTVTANIPMGTYKFTGLGAGTAATDSANLSQVQSTVTKLLASVSGADTITALGSPTLGAYAAGQMFYFVAAADNTGAVTLNIDSLGAKSVTRDGSVALAAGDIKSGEVVVVVYDGTRFQVVSQLNSSGDARFANVSIASALNVGGVATFTGGTANGVTYLNASKALTSGSALVFDGTNLGIGTNTPSSLGTLAVQSTSNVNGYFVNTSTSGSTASSQLRLATYDGSAVTVGSYLIETANSWSNTFFAGGVANTTALVGGKSGGVAIAAAGASAPIKFYAGGESSGSERMRLDASGNLGLGVTPSAWRNLFAAFQFGESGSVQSTNNNTIRTRLSNNTYINSSGDEIYLKNGAAHIYIQDSGGHQFFTAPSGTAGNTISFTQALTLNANGNLALQGGTTTASGVGVTFPASQSASSDANCLDDYEEGTFTPTAIGGTTAGTTTYGVQYGYYTKIGRQVNITLIVEWTAMTGTGTLVIGGLPFTVLNATQNYPVGACLPALLNWTAGTSIVALGIINTTTINLYGMSDDGGATSQQCVNEAADVRITLTYFV